MDYNSMDNSANQALNVNPSGIYLKLKQTLNIGWLILATNLRDKLREKIHT